MRMTKAQLALREAAENAVIDLLEALEVSYDSASEKWRESEASHSMFERIEAARSARDDIRGITNV